METIVLKLPRLAKKEKEQISKECKTETTAYHYDVAEHLRFSEGHVLGFAAFTK